MHWGYCPSGMMIALCLLRWNGRNNAQCTEGRTMQKITGTALDVCEGDIVFNHGYRCIASDVICHLKGAITELPTSRYTLHSAPDESNPQLLPTGYNGMRSGGNRNVWISIIRNSQ